MEPGLRLAEAGEDALAAWLVATLGGEGPPAGDDGGDDGVWRPGQVLVGPGDDAAVFRAAGPVVVSTDTLVEGLDFDLRWSDGHDLGVKAAAQNLADIAAMGAHPLGLLLSLAAPGDTSVDLLRGLAAGLAQECRRAGAGVLGGDLSGAREVVVTGTALGVLPPGRAAVLRSGARPGDVVALAGHTGASAAGLALLEAAEDRPRQEWAQGPWAGLVAAHLAPRPDYPAGPAAAAAGARALIDTSDGLVRDAARIAVASQVMLDLDPGALQPAAELLAVAGQLGDPGLAGHWVLTGGEDHALLGCFPPGVPLPAQFRPVGRVLATRPAGPGVLLDGQEWSGPAGWRHFTE